MDNSKVNKKMSLDDVNRILDKLNHMTNDEKEFFLLELEEKVTNRGFKLLQFNDDYETICDIQESSNIEPHIWLGTNNPNPKILASKTKEGGTGWVNYEIPEDVLVSHRMHLTPNQCVALGLELLKYGLFEEL